MTTTSIDIAPEGLGHVGLTVEDTGAGAAFLLLHGGAGPTSMRSFGARLVDEAGARVVLPTHPGFDLTPRPESLRTVRDLAGAYDALLDALDLHDVTVIGNSMGGWIALELALLRSPRVARTLVSDAVGIQVPGHPIADFFSLPFERVQTLSYHDPEPFRIDLASLPPAAKEAAAGNRAALAQYAGTSMIDPTLRDRLAGMDAPVLVVWGDSDGIADPVYGRTLADAILGARFILLPDTGHLPQIERPDLLLEVVREFTGADSGTWRRRFELETDLPPAAVWAGLRSLETGETAMRSGDGRYLEAAFEAGGTILATPAGLGRTLRSTIVDLVPEERLAVRTPFGALDLLLVHTLTATGRGGTVIGRELVISGDDAGEQGPIAGPRITADYDEALEEIVATSRGLA